MINPVLHLSDEGLPSDPNARNATLAAMHQFIDEEKIDPRLFTSKLLDGGKSNLYLALHRFIARDVVQKTIKRPAEIENQKYAYATCKRDIIIPRVLTEASSKKYSSFVMDHVPYNRMSNKQWLECADVTANILARMGERTLREDATKPPVDFLPNEMQDAAIARISHDWRVLVHNDVTRNNAGFSDGQFVLIDWGEACAGLPGADLWMFENWDAVSEEENERLASIYASQFGHGISVPDVRFASVLNGASRMHRVARKGQRFVDLYDQLCSKLHKFLQ